MVYMPLILAGNDFQWECNNGQCIPAAFECDGFFIPDCSDGSDEDEHCQEPGCELWELVCTRGEMGS